MKPSMDQRLLKKKKKKAQALSGVKTGEQRIYCAINCKEHNVENSASSQAIITYFVGESRVSGAQHEG